MHSNDPERCTTPGQGLDIGCGSNKGAGCVGMDRLPFDGVDVVFDFDSGQPWPFADSSFDFIRAIHVIEHVANPLHFFEEVHRWPQLALCEKESSDTVPRVHDAVLVLQLFTDA